MTWLEYLRDERCRKLSQIDAIETGTMQLFETVDGVTREVTGEQLALLKAGVAEIRQVLIDEGVSADG